MPLHIAMERIGELADGITVAIRPGHSEPNAAFLLAVLRDCRTELRAIFTAVTGDNPWQDASDVTGEHNKETA